MSSSSSSAAAAGGEETPVMYWCHECDKSIHLLFSSSTTSISTYKNGNNVTTSTAATTPTCPHCHHGFLELMDSTPFSSADSLDFLHLDSPTFRSTFFPERPTCEDDDHDEGDPDERSFFTYFRHLPTVRIGGEEADEEEEEEGSLLCAVCREQFGVDEEAKRLPCAHLFHAECILPWLSSGHLSCPLCRFQLLTDPSRVEEDDEDGNEEKWFLLLQSCVASSSSSSYYGGSHDDDASTCLPNADSRYRDDDASTCLPNADSKFLF